MLSAPENATRRCRKASEISLLQHDPRSRLSSQVEWHETMGTVPGSPTSKMNGSTFRSGDSKKDGDKKAYSGLGHTLGRVTRMKKVLRKMNIIPRTPIRYLYACLVSLSEILLELESIFPHIF